MNNCPQCNSPIRPDQKFCTKCGTNLTETQKSKIAPELEAAIDIHEKKIAQDSLNPKLYIDLGDLYQAHHRFEDALVQYQKAVNIEATNIDGHFRSADVYRALGKFDRAQSCYEKVLTLDPATKGIQKGLFLCLKETGKTSETIALGKELLTVNPKDVNILKAMKDLYLKISNDVEAQKMLEALATLAPDKELYRELAKISEKKGDKGQALSYYTKLIDLDSKDQEVLLLAGILSAEKGDTENTLCFLGKLLKEAPQNVVARAYSALSYSAKGDIVNAVETLAALSPKTLLSLNPETKQLLAKAYGAMGQKAFERGDAVKAKDYLKTSLKYFEIPDVAQTFAGIIGKEADEAFTGKQYYAACNLYEKAAALNEAYKPKLVDTKRIIERKARNKAIGIGSPILITVFCIIGFFAWRHFTTGVLNISFNNAISEIKAFEVDGKTYKAETQTIRLPKGEHKIFAKAKEGYKDSVSTVLIGGGTKSQILVSLDGALTRSFLAGVWKGSWPCSKEQICDAYIIFDDQSDTVSEAVLWYGSNPNNIVLQRGSYRISGGKLVLKHEQATAVLGNANNYNPDIRELLLKNGDLVGLTGDSKKPLVTPFSARKMLSGSSKHQLTPSSWVGEIYNRHLIKLNIKSLDDVTMEVMDNSGAQRAELKGSINKTNNQYYFKGKVTQMSGFSSYNPDDITFNFSPDGFRIMGQAADGSKTGSFLAVRITP